MNMASSDSQTDKPQSGCPERAELPDVNINTGVQSINAERAALKHFWSLMFHFRCWERITQMWLNNSTIWLCCVRTRANTTRYWRDFGAFQSKFGASVSTNSIDFGSLFVCLFVCLFSGGTVLSARSRDLHHQIGSRWSQCCQDEEQLGKYITITTTVSTPKKTVTCTLCKYMCATAAASTKQQQTYSFHPLKITKQNLVLQTTSCFDDNSYNKKNWNNNKETTAASTATARKTTETNTTKSIEKYHNNNNHRAFIYTSVISRYLLSFRLRRTWSKGSTRPRKLFTNRQVTPHWNFHEARATFQ